MASTGKKILVIGATGQQGAAATRRLLKAGWQVRALTRNMSQPSARELADQGAALVEGDLDKPQSVRHAFDDCYGVFCVLTFKEGGVRGEVRQGCAAAQAAADAGVQHFIYSSVGGADRNTGIPHFESKWTVEQKIRDLHLPATFIRPVWFMDNFRNWMLDPILGGELKLPVRPDRRLQMVAVDDIGHVAADCFDHRDEFLGRAIELAGDEMTLPQACMMMGDAIARPVTYVRQDIDEVRSQNPDFARMYQWFNDYGYKADIHALRKRFGYLMTFADYLVRTGWETLRQTHPQAART